MLEASAAAWNRGDLDRFLDDYAEDATFVGGSGLIRGVAELERRYRAAYWTDAGPRDTLRFADIRVTPLGPDHALAVGRFILTAPDGAVTSTGFFTLVLVRTGSGWRIVHDHSSEIG